MILIRPLSPFIHWSLGWISMGKIKDREAVAKIAFIDEGKRYGRCVKFDYFEQHRKSWGTTTKFKFSTQTKRQFIHHRYHVLV
ncbi:hypothetical protein BYT27DRAFT_7298001 [Phlegmacium glaucopus]|nr:hypothetical protein BYT27DRAFT_7298001 [Phlegmacium glaucopus]